MENELKLSIPTTKSGTIDVFGDVFSSSSQPNLKTVETRDLIIKRLAVHVIVTKITDLHQKLYSKFQHHFKTVFGYVYTSKNINYNVAISKMLEIARKNHSLEINENILCWREIIQLMHSTPKHEKLLLDKKTINGINKVNERLRRILSKIANTLSIFEDSEYIDESDLGDIRLCIDSLVVPNVNSLLEELL